MRRRTRRSLIAFAVVLLPVVFLTPSSVALVDKGPGRPASSSEGGPGCAFEDSRRRHAPPLRRSSGDATRRRSHHGHLVSQRHLAAAAGHGAGALWVRRRPRGERKSQGAPGSQGQPGRGRPEPACRRAEHSRHHAELRRHRLPGCGMLLRAAGHQRRSGSDAVRPDRQRRHPGLQQDDGRVRAGPCGHFHDLGWFRRRLPEQRPRRPDRALRPARQPLGHQPVRRHLGPDRRMRRRLDHQRRHRVL